MGDAADDARDWEDTLEAEDYQNNFWSLFFGYGMVIPKKEEGGDGRVGTDG